MAWSWATARGSREARRDAVLTEELAGEAGPTAIGCLASGFDRGGRAARAAEAAAGACLRRLAGTGEPAARLREATDAANRALAELKRDPEAVNAGATLTAVVIDADELWLRSVGDGAVHHCRARTGAVEPCNPPPRAQGARRPARALMGMPHEADGPAAAAHRVDPGDIVVLTSPAAAGLDPAAIAAALRERRAGTADEAATVLRAAVAQRRRGAGSGDVSAACYRAPAGRRARAGPGGTVIHGDRASSGHIRVAGRRVEPGRAREIVPGPGAFGWGYEGDGPLRLAAAILIEATGDVAAARRLHEKFAAERIAAIYTQQWEMTAASGNEWVAGQEAAGEPGAR